MAKSSLGLFDFDVLIADPAVAKPGEQNLTSECGSSCILPFPCHRAEVTIPSPPRSSGRKVVSSDVRIQETEWSLRVRGAAGSCWTFGLSTLDGSPSIACVSLAGVTSTTVVVKAQTIVFRQTRSHFSSLVHSTRFRREETSRHQIMLGHTNVHSRPPKRAPSSSLALKLLRGSHRYFGHIVWIMLQFAFSAVVANDSLKACETYLMAKESAVFAFAVYLVPHASPVPPMSNHRGCRIKCGNCRSLSRGTWRSSEAAYA